MKKPYDKKSASGPAKKPETPQITTPGTGAKPEAKPDRTPQSKHKGK
ncbi:MAG: hypothetical protein Q8S17_14670 [Humidesulfovibrio sp.]|nr:hypothetical protein [Humidesulfovibrio sp.]